jgi:hypothetical protein
MAYYSHADERALRFPKTYALICISLTAATIVNSTFTVIQIVGAPTAD